MRKSVMTCFTKLALIFLVMESNFAFSLGQCTNTFNQTSCLNELQCYSYEDIVLRGIDSNDPIWNYCYDFRVTIYNPNYGNEIFLPINLIYKGYVHDKSLEIPNFENYNKIEQLIKSLDISNDKYDVFPSLAAMESLEFLNISFNNLTSAKFSSKYNLLALKDIDISYNFINEIENNVDEFPFVNLIKLNISNNKLLQLKDATFSDFKNLQYLDISYNKISAINGFTFEGIKNLLYLNMAHNIIKEINNSLFRFSKLQYLYLNNNQINSVLVADFKNLNQLHEVDLSYNVISSVEKNVFDSMLLISKVNFRKNLLNYLDQRMFFNTISLNNIDFSFNEINLLPMYIFKGKNITYFDIRRNNLEGALIKGIFVGLSYVRELDISYQRLKSIKDFAFVGLEMLEILLLNNNQIQNVSQKSFNSLRNLKFLDLSHNQIVTFKSDLSELLKLEFLSVKSNVINSISKGHFDGLNILQSLDISNNNISTVESNSFRSLTELVNFDISKNPLSKALEVNTFEGLNALPVLDISCTSLTIIHNNSFNQMSSLHTLNVSHSTVNEVSFNSFMNTGNINVLDMSYNLLKVFNINTTTLVNLRMLYLNHNLINVVPPNFVSSYVMLNIINLSFNNISVLHNETFCNLKHVLFLDLSFNENLLFNITFIQNLQSLQKLYISGIHNVFEFDEKTHLAITDIDMSKSDINNVTSLRLNALQELNSLNLNNNKIKKIKVGAFTNLTRLNSLDMSYNELTFIQPGVFKDNHYLSFLNVSHNQLTSLGYGVFRGLAYLRTLDLSYNELQDLQSERFYGINKLNTLIVDYNKIRNIGVEDFSIHLSVLSIGGNPLSCDNLMKFKNKKIVITITALKLDESNYENIDGVICFGHKSVGNKYTKNVDDGSESILSDIRDILINLSSKKEINTIGQKINSESTQLEILTKVFNQTVKNTLQDVVHENNVSNKYLINYLNETVTNPIKDIIHENNISNSLMERILKTIVAMHSVTQISPSVLKYNGTNEDILPYIAKIKQEFENSLTIEKEKILSEVNNKISLVDKKILESLSTGKPPDAKTVTNPELKKENTSSLFTEVCVVLILIILLCFSMFKIYKYTILSSRRRSFSTQQIAVSLENSNL